MGDPMGTSSQSLRKTIRRSLRRSRFQAVSPKAWRARIAFWLGATAVGTVCFVFVRLGREAESLFRMVAQETPWLPLIITPAGFLLVAWATRRFFHGAEGGGIPQVIAALHSGDRQLREHFLSIRIGLGKFVTTIGGLLCGGALGMFAPSVQIAASLQRAIGVTLGIRRPGFRRALILAGGAAGISAAFGTPLAGIVFAIEELGKSFEQRASALMLSAVVIAGVTALAWSGGQSGFHLDQEMANIPQAWVAVVVVGISGGTLGGLFAIVLVATTRLTGCTSSRQQLWLALGGGLVVALCGYLTGGASYGSGISEAEALASGAQQYGLLFPLAKMGAMLGTFVAGVPGGLIGPGLAVGAGLGENLAALFPALSVTAVALLGMVGFFSGLLQAPLTAFVLLLELGGYRGLILPLMATSFIAHAISQAICHRALFQVLADNLLIQIDARLTADHNPQQK